jgi:hypothetical protein
MVLNFQHHFKKNNSHLIHAYKVYIIFNAQKTLLILTLAKIFRYQEINEKQEASNIIPPLKSHVAKRENLNGSCALQAATGQYRTHIP